MTIRTHTIEPGRREPLQLDMYENAYGFFEPKSAVRVKKKAKVARRVLRKLRGSRRVTPSLVHKVRKTIDRVTRERARPPEAVPDMPGAVHTRETDTDIYVQQTYHDAPILPLPRDAQVMPNYQPPGYNEPILDYDEIAFDESDLDQKAFQVTDDLPAPLLIEEEVPASWLDMPKGKTGLRMLKSLDSIPPPAYNVVGLPKGMQPVIEKPGEGPAVAKLDKMMRPEMLIEHQRVGLPYSVGEGQRYAGEANNPHVDDPSVIDAQPWQEFTALGRRINPFNTDYYAGPDIGSAQLAGMGAFDWSSIGQTLQSAVMSYGKDAAQSLKTDIDDLEAEIQRLSPERMADMASEAVLLRATVFNLWPEVEGADSADIGNYGTWFAAANKYRDKLQKILARAKDDAAIRAQDIQRAPSAPGAPGEPRDFEQSSAVKYGVPIAFGAVVLGVGAWLYFGRK